MNPEQMLTEEKKKATEQRIGVKAFAERLNVSESSARRILATEKPGVYRIFAPGRKRPIIRVDVSVVDRILRRSTLA